MEEEIHLPAVIVGCDAAFLSPEVSFDIVLFLIGDGNKHYRVMSERSQFHVILTCNEEVGVLIS